MIFAFANRWKAAACGCLLARRVAATLCCFLLAITGCNPPPLPKPPTTTAPATASTSPNESLDLVDYTTSPPLDESERDAPRLRIVSAAPNITEILCALGLRESLVGRTSFCVHPPDVRSIPAIGALLDLNVETLMSLKPDLVLVAGEARQTRDKLSTLNIRSEAVPDVTVDDLYRSIEKIGEWTHHGKTAAKLVECLRSDMDRVAQRYRTASPRRVLILTSTLSSPPSPPYVGGENSFYDWMLRRVGHQNVVAGHGRPFAPLSLEFIAQANPDVIVELAPSIAARPAGDEDARRAWAAIPNLRAVETGRVRVLCGGEYYLLGPRLAITFRDLCAAIAEN